VTYSHGDPDDTGVSKLRQWSQGFARELESEFKAHPKFARDIRIFLDQHPRPAQGIDPMAALTDQLRADIARSALLAVLMSPHYLRSAWCRDEREWWCSSQQELKLPLDGRVAAVRIWPTDEPWPAPLVDRRGEPVVGFCFYDREHADIRPQPFEWPEPGPTSRDPFRKELLNLVGWIGLKLEEVRQRMAEQRRAAAEAAKLAAGGGQVVYLHGRTEYARAWERANEALTSSGLVVMPNEPDPVGTDARRIQEIRQQRVETMSGCDALLLVGTDDGRAVDADLVVVGRLDRQYARSISNRLLPCAVLDAAGGIVATPKRKIAARSLNVEWIDATHEPWTPAVQQWLLESSRSEAPR
jgi:hypothetical protein